MLVGLISMRSFVLGLLLATAVAHNCRGERDCNPPQVFSDMTITAKPTTPITIIKSKNWDASGLDGPVQEGLRLVRRFLGHTEPTRVFLIAPGGTDADYADLKVNYCAYISHHNFGQCLGQVLDRAKSGGGTYQVGGRFLPAGQRCTCGEFANSGVPLIMSPRTGEIADGLQIAAHEYVHTYQKAMAGPVPAWWMEGGAVQIACMMGPQVTNPKWIFADRPNNAYSECYSYGGGREGVIIRIRDIYKLDLKVNWLKLYGEHRECGSAPLPGAGKPPDAAGSAIWYDMGAFGLAFAVHAANLNKNLTGASKLTTRDMWLGTGERGMWREVRSHKVNLRTGWANSVPEGAGWRKALCDFTGFGTTGQFYDALHAAMVPNGTLATNAQLLAYLESDADIKTQGAMLPSYTTPAKKNACFVAPTPPPTPAPTPQPTLAVGHIKIVVPTRLTGFSASSFTQGVQFAYRKACAQRYSLAVTRIHIGGIRDGARRSRRLSGGASVQFDLQVSAASAAAAAAIKVQVKSGDTGEAAQVVAQFKSELAAAKASGDWADMGLAFTAPSNMAVVMEQAMDALETGAPTPAPAPASKFPIIPVVAGLVGVLALVALWRYKRGRNDVDEKVVSAGTPVPGGARDAASVNVPPRPALVL